MQVGEHLLRLVGRINRVFSRVGNDSFFDPREFSWSSYLELNHESILKEIEGVMANEPIPSLDQLTSSMDTIANKNWLTFILYGYGIKVEANCHKCPITTALIERIPGVQTVMFSILAAKDGIPVHRGPYGGIILYHLGVKIPEGAWIKVGDATKYYKKGKSIIFDDTYPHSTGNPSDETRIVLFIQFERPYEWPMNIINKCILFLVSKTGFFREGVRNLKLWEKKEA